MRIAAQHDMSPNGNMKLPEKLRSLIKARRLSQAQLSRLIGRHQTTVSAWCRGLCTPTLGDGRLLAEALDVPLDFLADDGANEPKPPEFSDEERQLIRDARVIGIAEARRRILLASPSEPIHDGRFVGVATIERPAAFNRSSEPPGRTDQQSEPAKSDRGTQDIPSMKTDRKPDNPRR